MINIGYLTYRIISSIFIRKTDFEYINISIKKLIEIEGKEGCINKIIKIEIDIDGHKQDIYFYIIQNHLGYDLILGKL